jgi:hypothetical protein
MTKSKDGSMFTTTQTEHWGKSHDADPASGGERHREGRQTLTILNEAQSTLQKIKNHEGLSVSDKARIDDSLESLKRINAVIKNLQK